MSKSSDNQRNCRLCGQAFSLAAAMSDRMSRSSSLLCPQCRSVLRPPKENATAEEPFAEEAGEPSVFNGETQTSLACDEREAEEEEGDKPAQSRRAAAARKEAGQAAQAAAAERGPAVGKRFGNYVILDEINRGSFGVVYKARQLGLDRAVALKVLLAGTHASKDAVARFQREARAVAQLRHPNIVPIYDIGEVEGRPYFAMEFIDGVPLSALSAKGPVSVSLALTLGETLADALAAAHRAGVIHRDVKPSNILIDADGEPHLTDFGLAKQVDSDSQYTQAGTTLGTPAYMPPEQARGEIEKVRETSDLYALGAVLYELLTGRAPFGGRSLLEVIVAVINEPVQPPRKLNPKIHRDVQTIILKCLEKDPRLRYASADDLRDDLRRFRAGEAIRAVPISPLRLAARFLWRNRVPTVAAVIVFVALGFAAWYGMGQSIVTQQTREELNEQLRKQQESETKKRQELDELRKRRPVEFWRWSAESEEGHAQPGFTHPIGKNPRDFPDLEWDERTKRHHVIDLKPEQVLVAPPTPPNTTPPRAMYGDWKAEVRFTFDPAKAGSGLRIGMQSIGAERVATRVAFILELSSRRVCLFGPDELYQWANEGGRLPLRDLAEKEGPVLVAGTYALKINLEGLDLTFALFDAEGNELTTLQIHSLALSHWLFKNTQLTVHRPPPDFRPLQIVIHQITGGDVPKGVSYFLIGDYNGAEPELNALKDTGENVDRPFGDPWYQRAGGAWYYLGLMREIYGDWPKAEAAYSEAVACLRKAPWSEDRRNWERRISLRRTVNFCLEVRRKKTDEGLLQKLRTELPQVLGRNGKIGEPEAWDLVPALEALAFGEADKNTSADDDMRNRVGAAMVLFKHLDLSLGSRRLENVAEKAALFLAKQHDVQGLMDLHRSYRTERLCSAFVDVINSTAAKAEDSPNWLENFAEPAFFHAVKNFHSPENKSKLKATAAELLPACLIAGRFQSSLDAVEALPVNITPALGDTWGKALAKYATSVAARDQHDGFWLLLEKFLHAAMELPAEGRFQPRESLRIGIETLGLAFADAGRISALKRLFETTQLPGLSAALALAVKRTAAGGIGADWRKTLDLLAWCAEHANREYEKVVERDKAKTVEKVTEKATAHPDLIKVVKETVIPLFCRGENVATNMKELHAAFPAPALAGDFAEAIQMIGERALKSFPPEEGTDPLDKARREILDLLRFCDKTFSLTGRESVRLAAEKSARTSVFSAAPDLMELYKAFPHPALATVFAERIRDAAKKREKMELNVGLDLALFCSQRIYPVVALLKDEKSPERQAWGKLEDASAELAKRFCVPGEERQLPILRKIIQTVNLPKTRTIELYGALFKNLATFTADEIKAEARIEEALDAWGCLWALSVKTALDLKPMLAAALQIPSKKARAALCEAAAKKTYWPADESQKSWLWKMEIADLLVAVGAPTTAEKLYEKTARAEDCDPSIAALAAFRADAMNLLKPGSDIQPQPLWSLLNDSKLETARATAAFLRGELTETAWAEATAGGKDDPFRGRKEESLVRIIRARMSGRTHPELEKVVLGNLAGKDWTACFLSLFLNQEIKKDASAAP